MLRWLPLVMTVFLVTACAQEKRLQASNDFRSWMQHNNKIKVLSTTAMIDDVVSQVGGDHVDSLTLIQGELDPHSYQLVKGDDEKLRAADLIFYNGLGLEHGPSLQHYLQNNPRAVALGDEITQAEPHLILKVDGQTDPHIWMDISLWSRTIPFIVKALSERDPAHAEDYKANGQRLLAEMQKEHQELRNLLQQIPDDRRYLVTSHDAFNYFTRAYLRDDNETTFEQWSPRFMAPEGLAPDSQLSTTDIQKTLDHLIQYHVAVIFPESNVSKDSIRKIVSAAKEKGLTVRIADRYLYGDAMGRQGSDGDTYLKMVKHNANTLYTFWKDED